MKDNLTFLIIFNVPARNGNIGGNNSGSTDEEPRGDHQKRGRLRSWPVCTFRMVDYST
jgi:hypothetical protein